MGVDITDRTWGSFFFTKLYFHLSCSWSAGMSCAAQHRQHKSQSALSPPNMYKCTVYVPSLQRTSVMEGSTWSSFHWCDEIQTLEMDQTGSTLDSTGKESVSRQDETYLVGKKERERREWGNTLQSRFSLFELSSAVEKILLIFQWMLNIKQSCPRSNITCSFSHAHF